MRAGKANFVNLDTKPPGQARAGSPLGEISADCRLSRSERSHLTSMVDGQSQHIVRSR